MDKGKIMIGKLSRLLAIIVMTITPKRQRIGDLIAKTVVVKP